MHLFTKSPNKNNSRFRSFHRWISSNISARHNTKLIQSLSESRREMNIFYYVLGSRHKPVIKSYKNIIGKKSARLISRHKSLQEILANQIQQYIWREVIESRQALLFENSHLAIITPTPMTKLLKASPIFVHLCLLNSSISSLKIFLSNSWHLFYS